MTLKSDVTTNVEFTIPYYRTAVPDELLQQLMEDGLSNAEIGYLLLRQLFTEIVNSLDPEQWPHYLPDFNKHSKELRGAAQRLCPTRCTFSFWHIGTETPAVTLPDDGTREFVIERVSIRTTTDERDDPQHGPPPGHQFVRFYAIRIVAQVKYIAYYRAICEESLGREEGF